MNQATHAVSVSVAVITNTNEMVKELIARKNYSGSTPMTESVNDVFAIGLEQADYIAPESMFNMSDFGNGTGYYDPLMTVGFEDEVRQTSAGLQLGGNPRSKDQTSPVLDRVGTWSQHHHPRSLYPKRKHPWHDVGGHGLFGYSPAEHESGLV